MKTLALIAIMACCAGCKGFERIIRHEHDRKVGKAALPIAIEQAEKAEQRANAYTDLQFDNQEGRMLEVAKYILLALLTGKLGHGKLKDVMGALGKQERRRNGGGGTNGRG